MTTFTHKPSYPASAARKPKVRSIVFGDNYEQRRTDGINTLAEMWDLQFNGRLTSEIDEIEAILIAAGGVNYFNWTTPTGEDIKVICREWVRTPTHGNIESLSCKFEQVFDPA